MILRPIRQALRAPALAAIASGMLAVSSGAVGGTPVAPTLADFVGQQVTANTWRNINWSTAGYPGTWIEPAHGGDTYSPIVHVWTPTVARSGRVWLRLHPAGAGNGGTPEIPAGGSIDTQWLQVALAHGDVVFSGTAPHSGIWVNSLGAYQTNDFDIFGKLVQFVRSLATAFDFDPAKLTTLAQSRGNHVLLSAFRADLANPSAPTFAGRCSSIPNLMLHINSQCAYNPRRAGDEACSDFATESAAFYAVWGNPDDTRLCAGDLIATAPQLPPFVTSYDMEFPSIRYSSPDGKVPVATILADATSHWPQWGKVFGREYAKRGASDKFMCWANSEAGGDAEQLGAYAVAAREFYNGATLQDAMATGMAVKRGHNVIAARSSLVGVWQVNDGQTTPTGSTQGVAGQPVGAIADLSVGILAAGTNPMLGKPGGQTSAAQRTTLVATAGGYGFSVVPTQRILVNHAGTSNDGRQGRSWTSDGIRWNVPSLRPSGAIGFGTAQLDNKTIVVMAVAPLGTSISDQDARVYDHAAYQRIGNWTPFLIQMGYTPP